MAEMLDRSHTTMMLAVVFFATFMDGLDSSIVNVTLPVIGTSFGIDTATVSWTTIVYLMILAGTLVAFARIAADTDVKKIMAAGLAVFTVGSAMCGLSPSFAFLIMSRAVQAVGAAMMGATAPMCCTEHLPRSKLGLGLSVVTIGSSVGFALGPFLGGIIIDHTTWHWVFLINIPMGLIAIPLMLKAIPSGIAKNKRVHLDVSGAVILFIAIVLVTFAIETLSYSSMRMISVVCLVLGIALLYIFAVMETKTEIPLVKISMFRHWDFTAIFTCLMMINMACMGFLYLVPFFGEICLGLSASAVGMYMLCSATPSAILGMPFSKWSDRRGRRPFCIAAGLICGLGILVIGLFARDLTPVGLAFGLALTGVAWACVGGPMASRLVEHAGKERDMASSLTNEGYYIGGAIGTAIAAMLFTIFSNTDGIDISAVSSSAFLDGFMPTCFVLVGICILISVLSFLVKDEN